MKFRNWATGSGFTGLVGRGLAYVVVVAVCGLVTGFGAMRGLIVVVGLTIGVVPGGMKLVHIGGATLISWTVCGAGGAIAGVMTGAGGATLGIIVGPTAISWTVCGAGGVIAGGGVGIAAAAAAVAAALSALSAAASLALACASALNSVASDVGSVAPSLYSSPAIGVFITSTL